MPFCCYVKWWDSKVLYQLIFGFDFRAGQCGNGAEDTAYLRAHIVDSAAVILQEVTAKRSDIDQKGIFEGDNESLRDSDTLSN